MPKPSTIAVSILALQLGLLLPAERLLPRAMAEPAQQPADSVSAAEAAAEDAAFVEQMLEQLDEPTKARRDAAEQALIERGPKILQLLPDEAAARQISAEAALRIERVRAALEIAAAKVAASASPITLQGQDLTLAEVLAEIEKQTGNKLVDVRERFGEQQREIRLDVDFNKTPFWTAVDTLLERGQLRIYPYGDTPGLPLVSQHSPARPKRPAGTIVDNGVFRIAADSLTASRELDQPEDGSLEVGLSIFWEPRIRPIVILHELDSISASDDRGQALSLQQAGSTIELPVDNQSKLANLPVRFALPSREAREIRTLRGKLSALVAGKVEQFRFTDLTAKNTLHRRAGLQVVLEQAARTGPVWEVRLRLTFDNAGQALESHRNWVFDNPIWIETPGGEKLSYDGYQTTRQTEDSVGVAYYFDLPADPKGYTLVYESPASIHLLPVEFQLSNLELP